MNNTPKRLPIDIDTESGIPLWLQLRNRLIYLITSGHCQKGDKLPTVRRLAVDLGINFNTVSKVYRDIERDGYIVSRQGAGTFVHDAYLANDGLAVTEVELLIDEFIRECIELGVPRDDIAGLVIVRLMGERSNERIYERPGRSQEQPHEQSCEQSCEQSQGQSQEQSRKQSQEQSRELSSTHEKAAPMRKQHP